MAFSKYLLTKIGHSAKRIPGKRFGSSLLTPLIKVECVIAWFKYTMLTHACVMPSFAL